MISAGHPSACETARPLHLHAEKLVAIGKKFAPSETKLLTLISSIVTVEPDLAAIVRYAQNF
jgi:hypothetical protein